MTEKSDPPNALDMISIAEEAYRKYDEMRDNAEDVQHRYALAAILQGVPPEEVAARCGFALGESPPQIVMTSWGPQIVQGPTMEGFGHWMCKWLYEQIVAKETRGPITGGTIIYTDGYLPPPDDEKDNDDD